MSRKRRRRPLTPKERALLRRKRKRRRLILILAELLVLAVLSVAAFVVFKLDLMNYNPLNEKNLDIYQDTGDYTNIALFGLDSREGELEKGARSDSIIIASINNKTKEVKLLSVYRDTLLKQDDDTYDKANSAYFYGGPEAAIALLNRNLDLDIKKYISVNFNSLSDIIDALGGLEINVTEEEVPYVNAYTVENIKVTGKDSLGIESAGLQTLNGIQATAYARIRYTSGDDFKRTERQRLVLQKIAEKAQAADISTLNRIIDQVLPEISTNLTAANFMGLAANGLKYSIGESKGFPFDVTTSESVLNHDGSYVIPIGFSDNVSQLHQFLFGDKDYKPSDLVEEISNDIIYLSGVDPADYTTNDSSSSDNEDSSGDPSDSSDEEDSSSDSGSDYNDSSDEEDTGGYYD